MARLDQRVLQHQEFWDIPLHTWHKEWSDLRLGLHPRFSRQCLADGLRALLDRSWFQRVWILQEAASARNANITCGGRSVSARTFVIMPYLLGTEATQHVKAVLDIMPGPKRRDTWYEEDRTLATLLKKFEHSKASFGPDRVYVLLGISTDASDTRRFPPNYHRGMYSTLQNTILFLIFGEMVPEDLLNVRRRNNQRDSMR